jgi:hypothetical protein
MLTIEPGSSPVADLLDHVARHSLTAQECALQIYAHDPVEISFFQIQKLSRVNDSGIVDQGIDRTEGIDGLGHQIVDIEPLGNVGGGKPNITIILMPPQPLRHRQPRRYRQS